MIFVPDLLKIISSQLQSTRELCQMPEVSRPNLTISCLRLHQTLDKTLENQLILILQGNDL